MPPLAVIASISVSYTDNLLAVSESDQYFEADDVKRSLYLRKCMHNVIDLHPQIERTRRMQAGLIQSDSGQAFVVHKINLGSRLTESESIERTKKARTAPDISPDKTVVSKPTCYSRHRIPQYPSWKCTHRARPASTSRANSTECKRLGGTSKLVPPPCNFDAGQFSPEVHEGTTGLRGRYQLPVVEEGNGDDIS